ncbi:TPA: transcription antiterminator [Streptococcus suis]
MLTKRQLRLVDILEKSNDFQTVAQLANSLSVSERTLYTELKTLEKVGLEIKKKRGYGVKLIIQDENIDNLSDFEIDSVLSRRIDIMRRLVFNRERITMFGLSEEYFTSTTSIQNDLHSIESILLHGTTVKLISNHLGTRLSDASTEELIKVMVNFNSFIVTEAASSILDEGSKINRLTEFYSEEIVNVCKNILYSFVKENVDTISDTYVESFLRHLIVLVYLLKNNHHLALVGKPVDYYQHAFYIDSAVKLLHKASLRLNFDYVNDDVQYLSLLLLHYRFEQLPAKDLDNKIIKNLIDHVSQAMNIDFMQDETLFHQLQKHVPAMLSRLKHQTVVKNPFTEQIKLEYSITYNTLWLVAENLLQKADVRINSDEIAFLTLYFQLSIEKIGGGRKILVICPTGIVTSELLINRIKTVSPSFDIVEVASVSEAMELNLDSYDVILTTVKLNRNIRHAHFVSPLISNDELNRLFSNKKVNREQEITENILHKYLSEEAIFINSSLNSREDVFNFASHSLKELDYVRESFVDSLLEREAFGGTDLPIGVAIPHGKSTDVKKTFVSILKLDKKIHWQDYKVNLIFIIGITAEDINQTKRIISNIYNIINNEQILNKLRSARTSKEVEKIIYGG